jgi:hypothetical protein
VLSLINKIPIASKALNTAYHWFQVGSKVHIN